MAGPIRIGVLALQGSFREHMTLLNRIPGVDAVEVGAAAGVLVLLTRPLAAAQLHAVCTLAGHFN